ncbi:hypothetical protein [Pontibacillus sp. HMF3514]|uniref:hypothetical protein n=1 Tax=Pontibacillus sp. HMF3514 TaxID=2692425 RepID=UPI00131F6F70|nr:hypothetical protein [Pontibacillus sp. HMF3514]QHE52716.1 hypothetical protein GS400_12040 [Pontibacillus sp. HMF3514]
MFGSVMLIYNHKQSPTEDDVFNITENWDPATEDVYLVRKVNGEWLTIFRNQHTVMLAELKRKWTGNWEIRDEMGNESSISSTYYPPNKEQEITWSAGGVGQKEIVYYFGQIINPEIHKVTVETEEKFNQSVPIIKAEGKRFFFKKLKGAIITPVNINGYSKSGEQIYSSLSD